MKYTLPTILVLAATCLALGVSGAKAQQDTLIDESFNTGSYNAGNHSTVWTHNGISWNWSDLTPGGPAPTDTETYSSPSPRMPAQSNHDGGFEVYSDSPSVSGAKKWAVSTEVSLPVNFTSLQDATISFDYGFRGSVVPATFSLYDVTTSSTIFNTSLSAPSTGVWHSENITLDSSDLAGVLAGNLMELQWTTTSSASAVSLEVGGPVIFSVGTSAGSAPGAPAPPMSACLAFAAVLALQALRSRKTA